jgi:hypothetical protein
MILSYFDTIFCSIHSEPIVSIPFFALSIKEIGCIWLCKCNILLQAEGKVGL